MTSPADALQWKADYTLHMAALDDLHLILDSWCSSQADMPHYGPVSREIFKVEMRARVARILQYAKCAVIRPTQAFNERFKRVGMHSEVLSWACYDHDKRTELPVVHYVYTKAPMRRRGLARFLLEKAVCIKPGQTWWASHSTPIGRKLIDTLEGTYNPFLNEYMYHA